MFDGREIEIYKEAYVRCANYFLRAKFTWGRVLIGRCDFGGLFRWLIGYWDRAAVDFAVCGIDVGLLINFSSIKSSGIKLMERDQMFKVNCQQAIPCLHGTFACSHAPVGIVSALHLAL